MSKYKMTPQQLSTIIQSAVALVILLWMLAICVPSLRLDVFRQRMFIVRDQLFDYARAGNISFEHPAYRLLRKSMNGFIRYGHRLSFFQLCITFCRWHFSEEEPVSQWHQQWKPALDSIDDENVKRELLQFQLKSMGIVAGRIVTGSPILLTVVSAMILAESCRGAWKSTSELYRIAVERTFKLFSIKPEALEDEALKNAA
jgi:hypothetical protein